MQITKPCNVKVKYCNYSIIHSITVTITDRNRKAAIVMAACGLDCWQWKTSILERDLGYNSRFFSSSKLLQLGDI